MTIDELSVYLQISKSSLYKLCQEGKVPGQKVGKHWRFHKEAVDAWLKPSHHDELIAKRPAIDRGEAP